MSGLVLALDGALGAFSVALVSRSVAPPRSAAAAGSDALERGLALVRDVLGETRPAELERIVVTTGPGSFTGLRIAVAYAKSLAFAAAVPLVGVGSFEVLDDGTGGPRLAVIAARTGRVHARLRTADGTSRRFEGDYAETARHAAGIAAGGPLGLAGYGAAAAGVAAALAEHGSHVISVPLPVPVALAVAARGLDRPPLVAPHALTATYGDE